MTSVRVLARPGADSDVEAAFHWYEAQELGLGDQFLDELRATYDRIAAGPSKYQRVGAEVRRALLRRFPYWHLAGLALVIAGAWLVLGSLGMLRAPVRLIAAVVAIAGVAISAHDLMQLQQFHLFATTLAVSGAGVGLLYRG